MVQCWCILILPLQAWFLKQKIQNFVACKKNEIKRGGKLVKVSGITKLNYQDLPNATQNALLGWLSVQEDREEEQHITWSEAVKSLETFIKFAEKSPQYNSAEVMNLHIILNKCYSKLQNEIEETDIHDYFKKASGKVSASHSNTTVMKEDCPRPLEQQEPMPGPRCHRIKADLLAYNPLPIVADSDSDWRTKELPYY